ncbi:MAG: hypothetical protein FWC26_12175 [Fibromonadales bacterium]|nr:hypothetical protein [Fibromonadales bacterium]
MKKVIKSGLIALIVLTICACGDGYKTVKIGNQTWMAENLNDASKGGVCYDNDPANCKKYGRLYTLDEAMKACKKGWHLPNNAEWEALVDFAGGKSVAGRKLKDRTNGGDGADEYGFSALLGGKGYSNGGFNGVGDDGIWWSVNGYEWYVEYGNSKVGRSRNDDYLFSVRCIRDVH